MEGWRKISLPAKWKISYGYLISNQEKIYEQYFLDNKIEYKMLLVDPSSDLLYYKIKTNDEELITFIKLKMSV
jgi:hypothetical protein